MILREQQQCTSIALMGAPNAGKSTLVNKIIGSKISIVSPKVQTTRTTIKGIYVKDSVQLIFIDTPGIFKPIKNLEKAIVKEAWKGVYEAEHHALLIDAVRGLNDNSKMLIQTLHQHQRETVLILNKIDRIPRHNLLGLAQEANKLFPFKETFMVSAKKGDGVEAIVNYYTKLAPVTPWIYEEDSVTDAPLYFYASELTREQLFL